MTHNPDYFEVMPQKYKNMSDLTLAWHVHAWQWSIFHLWAPFASMTTDYWKKYLYWLKDYNDNLIYITSWIGWVPLRFFARPEIVVITL